MPLHSGRILFEDQWLLAVHKLPFELTVAGSGKMQKLSLFDFLKKDHPGIHPLNRLDFETSGIVVFAKNNEVLEKVTKSKFKGWTKTYHTIVAGVLKKNAGTITLKLPSRAKGEEIDATTSFKVLERFPFATYIEAEIQAGKHHQIRRHMAMIGHPLALDKEYGEGKFNNQFGQKFKFYKFFLHALAVSFPHPVTDEEITIEDPLPATFEAVLEKLRKAR